MTRLAIAGLAAVLALAGPAARAADGPTTYKATLTGASEVPPTTSTATGDVVATYDPATKRLRWQGTYTGLTGPATAAHFHGPAKPGENAGVLVPAPAAGSPFSGETALDESKAADLEGGRMYFNIHTAANPKGEIRGQMMPAR